MRSHVAQHKVQPARPAGSRCTDGHVLRPCLARRVHDLAGQLQRHGGRRSGRKIRRESSSCVSVLSVAEPASRRVIGFLGGRRVGHAARLTEAGELAVFADMHELPGLIALAEQSTDALRRSA